VDEDTHKEAQSRNIVKCDVGRVRVGDVEVGVGNAEPIGAGLDVLRPFPGRAKARSGIQGRPGLHVGGEIMRRYAAILALGPGSGSARLRSLHPSGKRERWTALGKQLDVVRPGSTRRSLVLHPFPGRAKPDPGSRRRFPSRSLGDLVPLRGNIVTLGPDRLPLRFAPLQASRKGGGGESERQRSES
jgi:hypothetical protein